MKRGDMVTVAVKGAYGKPRPAVVVQSDLFAETASVTVLPFSTTLVDAPLLRITVEPTGENGLRERSQIMVDKITTQPRDRIGPIFGRLDDGAMLTATRHMALFLGLG